MDLITSLLDGLDDLSKLVPELDAFLGGMELIVSLCLLAGPLVLLGLGIWYLFAPPQEANHRAGFRTYFGMGSVEAWQYTQSLAGRIWSGLGLLLTVAMAVVCLVLIGKDTMQMASTAFVCLCIQAVLVLAGYIAVCVMTARRFDKDGNLRK